MNTARWVTFHGREVATNFDFQLTAVPLARIYAITQRGEVTVLQILSCNSQAGPILMETKDDFESMLRKVTA